MGALKCLSFCCGCKTASICRFYVSTGPCDPSWYAILVKITSDATEPNCKEMAPGGNGREYLLFSTGLNQWARAPHADGIEVSITAVMTGQNVASIMKAEITHGGDFIRIEWPAPQQGTGPDCATGQDIESLLSSSCGTKCIIFSASTILASRWYNVTSPPSAIRLDVSVTGQGGGTCTSSWSDTLPLQSFGGIHDGYALGALFTRGVFNQHLFSSGIGATVFGSYFPDDLIPEYCVVQSSVVDLCGRKNDSLSPDWPTFTWPQDLGAGCTGPGCVGPDSATVTVTEL